MNKTPAAMPTTCSDISFAESFTKACFARKTQASIARCEDRPREHGHVGPSWCRPAWETKVRLYEERHAAAAAMNGF
jgi:hypothetical protein